MEELKKKIDEKKSKEKSIPLVPKPSEDNERYKAEEQRRKKLELKK